MLEDSRSESESGVSRQYLVNENLERERVQMANNQPNNVATSPSTSAGVTTEEWITVVILCFVNLINYMDRITIAGILDEIQHQFRIDNSKSGLLQTAFIVTYMIFAPLFGYLGDRYNRKIIMSCGIFIWSLTTFLGSLMEKFEWFLIFRMFVGIGEASYSTIAPTIISDLFVKDTRSKMLALFYFAIPVGSGLGYIISEQMSLATGRWQWALRITPVLGLIAIVLIIFFIRDPARGEKEGGSHVSHSSWSTDIKVLTSNRSFMYSTAGFTCVAFVTGALSLWAPKFLKLGLELQASQSFNLNQISFIFGLIAMITGLIGVPLGSFMAQKFRVRWSEADPLICAIGLLISSPLIYFALCIAAVSSSGCFVLIFLGQLALNLNWSIVADILLYVVIPTRRSTAEAFQILIAHALGDAGSPYIIGLMSEGFKPILLPPGASNSSDKYIETLVEFRSLQYSLFLTIFIEVIGALFFFMTAIYIQKDKTTVDIAITAESLNKNKNNGQTESTHL